MTKTINTLLLLIIPFFSYSQVDSIFTSFDSVKVDTTYVDVFAQAPNAKFKLDYYHTDGYSIGNRYWYEVIIIDSLLILNFKSPENDDWHYINYQKQIILNKETLTNIQDSITYFKIQQKSKGIPLPPGTGYGADRLYIENETLNIAGGTVYICVGKDCSIEDYKKRINKEKEISTTINGNFQKLFDMLERLFTDLPMLLKSKDK